MYTRTNDYISRNLCITCRLKYHKTGFDFHEDLCRYCVNKMKDIVE